MYTYFTTLRITIEIILSEYVERFNSLHLLCIHAEGSSSFVYRIFKSFIFLGSHIERLVCITHTEYKVSLTYVSEYVDFLFLIFIPNYFEYKCLFYFQ